MAKEIVIPISENGRAMSPYERSTGVVLPIWGPPGGPRDRHHAHFYKSHFERGPQEQRAFLRAVRFTRLQRVRIKGAHDVYHDAYDGTADPVSMKQAFRTTILNEAGYIPPFVVDVQEGEPVIKETTSKMRQALRRPGILTIEKSPYRQREVGQFLMGYAIWQPLGHVKETLLEEFVSLTPGVIKQDEAKRERKFELGMKLTNVAIGVAVEPVEKYFQQARDTESLKHQAPVCAFHEVKEYVSGFEPEYFDTLQQSVAAQIAA